MYTIIGAGIGGLATALAFEKCGIEYQLFEKCAELQEVGAGIWLAPNALQIIEWLGVLEDIKSSGNSIDRITLAKADFSALSDNEQDDMKAKFGYSTIAIHRAELQRVLASKIPQEKIHLGKAFQKFQELDNKKIKVTFEDQTSIETDFLIGADGIHSKVRNQLFPQSKTRYSGQTCWRGISDFQLNEDYEHRGIESWGNQIRFGLSQVAKNKVYWFAVGLSEANLKDNRAQVKNELVTKYQDFNPLVNQIIKATSTEKILRNDINDLVPLEKWYQNNICLIGDACHATTPNLGQGGAQAIEDAYYLSRLIKDNPSKNVFQSFQEKRTQKVKEIVNQSWNTGKMAHWKYGKSLRNLLLKSLPKKMMTEKLMEVYTIEK